MYKHSICNIFSTINGMHATYCTIFRSVIEALIFPYKISTNANNTGGPMLPLETITFSLRVIVTYDFSRFAYIFLYFPRRFLNAGHCASMWLSARCSFSSFPPPHRRLSSILSIDRIRKFDVSWEFDVHCASMHSAYE